MAIGYRGVDGEGRVGIWGPLLFSTPLLAAWYAFERLDSATRSYRQTIEALAMAPELGGMVPAGHAERVAALASAMGEQLGLSAQDVNDLEMAALLHHLGQVTLDEPSETQGEVAAVTGAMLHEIRPLTAAGDIVAGDTDDPRRRIAVQVLRIASEYDDLTVRDHIPGDLALESLRSAPGYVYEAKVLERARARARAAPQRGVIAKRWRLLVVGSRGRPGARRCGCAASSAAGFRCTRHRTARPRESGRRSSARCRTAP